MTISEVRHAVGMSQQSFANYFGIPVGTLRNWEQGIAKPPEYVFSMIFQTIRRDKMINIETIKFVRMLEELAAKSKNGIEAFCNATEKNFSQKVFYSENCDYKVILDACLVDEKEYYHHDIISFYEGSEYVVNTHFDEADGAPYLVVTLIRSDEQIVVENGEWHFA